MTDLDFSRCRSVWIPAEERWNPPPWFVKEGVQWIIDHPYGLLATDMGGCKTAQALIAAQFLHDTGEIDRLIIIALASIRSTVWFDRDIGQIAEQAFDDKNVLVSEFHARLKQWQRGPIDKPQLRIIVTNYEYIRAEENLVILQRYCTPKTMLVLDESSAVRGPDSAQTDAIMRLRWQQTKKHRPILGAPRCGRVLELNGTPNAESPMDLFSQCNILHPSILDCKYKSHFKARYALQEPVMKRGAPMVMYGKPVTTITGWSDEGIKDLQRRMAPYVLRREAKEFGVDFALPPVGIEVPLTSKTWKHYVEMRDQLCTWLETGVVHASQAGVKTIRLSQITSGFLGGVEDQRIDDEWIFDDAGPFGIHGDDVIKVPPPSAIQEIGREKLDFALAWHADKLRQYPDLKLLTWCRWVPELRRYLSEVQKLTPIIGAACGQKVIDDERSFREEREHAMQLLNPKTAPAGACTLGATQGTGAMGLNFTACRTSLEMSYDFSSFKKKQGDARTNRTGQVGPVSYFYLIAVGPRGQRTIDMHVYMQRMGKIRINDLTTAGWCKMLREE